MIGFYGLRTFIKEAYERESERGPLNFRSASSVNPAFKRRIIEKLGIDDATFNGIIGTLHYFGLVDANGRLTRLKGPRALYDAIASSKAFDATVRNLVSLNKELLRKGLSLDGYLLKELAEKIVATPKFRNVRVEVGPSTASVLLSIARAFVPFIIVPAGIVSGKRESEAVKLSLAELGGLARISDVYEQARETGRLGNPGEFLRGLSSAMIVEESVSFREPSKIVQRAAIAITRFIRAKEELTNTNVERVTAFLNRVEENALRLYLAAGFDERLRKRQVLNIIDESVAKDAEEFLNAYGKIKIVLSDASELIKKYSAYHK